MKSPKSFSANAFGKNQIPSQDFPTAMKRKP
jgi:hypothetical protein